MISNDIHNIISGWVWDGFKYTVLNCNMDEKIYLIVLRGCDYLKKP